MSQCINQNLNVTRIKNVVLPLQLLRLSLSVEELANNFNFITGVYIPSLPDDDLELPGVFIPEDANIRPFIPVTGLPPIDFIEKIPKRPGIPGVLLNPKEVFDFLDNSLPRQPIFIPEVPADDSISGLFVPGIPGFFDTSASLDSNLSYIVNDFIPITPLEVLDPYEPNLPNYNPNYPRESLFIPNENIVTNTSIENPSAIPGVLIPGSNLAVRPIDTTSTAEELQPSDDSQEDFVFVSVNNLTVQFPITLGDPVVGVFIPDNPLIPIFIPGFPYIPENFIPSFSPGQPFVGFSLPILVPNKGPNRDREVQADRSGQLSIEDSVYPDRPPLPVPNVTVGFGRFGIKEETPPTQVSYDEGTRFDLIVIRYVHEVLRELNREITIIISKVKTFTYYRDKFVETQGFNFVNQANISRYEILESAVTNSIATAENLVKNFKQDNSLYKSYWELIYEYSGVYKRTQERTQEIYQNSYSTANIIMSHVTQGNKIEFHAGRVIRQATHFINLAKAEVQNYAPITTTISEIMETHSVSNRLTSDEIERNSFTDIVRTVEMQELVSSRFSHISAVADWRTKQLTEHVESDKLVIIGGSESKDVTDKIVYKADGTITIASNTRIVLNAPEVVIKGLYRRGKYEPVAVESPSVPDVEEPGLNPYYERVSSHPSNLASSGYGDIPRDTDQIPPPTVGTDGTIMSHLITPGIAANVYKRIR